MDLPALRAVVAVADELHFGRAAHRLGVTQPQVSQQVRRLERDWGLLLFDRDRHGVSVTAAGAQLVEMARGVVGSAERLDRLAAGMARGTAGTAALGAVGSAFFGPLSTLLAPCREHLPEVELTVREMESPEQLAALANGSLDVGLLRPPVPAPLYVCEAWSEPLVVALPREHRLADSRGRLVRDELVDEPVVLFRRSAGPGYWDVAAALLTEPGTDLEPVAEADHVTTVLGLVSLGRGLSVVPASMQHLHLPDVVFAELAEPVRLPLHLAMAPDAGPAARQVAATIRDVAHHQDSPRARRHTSRRR